MIPIYGSPPVGMDIPYSPYNSGTNQTEVQKVTGRKGAEMYRIAPNSSALLLDLNDPIVWFIQTDSAGYKTILPYDIKPHEEEQPSDIKDVNSRLDDMDARLKQIEEALK